MFEDTWLQHQRNVCVCVLELESVKLARLVFNRLFEMCCLWMKELPFRRRPQPYYETSIHAIKNMRRKMEDKHVIIPDFNTLFNVQVDTGAAVQPPGQSGLALPLSTHRIRKNRPILLCLTATAAWTLPFTLPTSST